ncbi:10922_t:CDS:2 [Ambispora leptoticha]|uniref:10922_t:CDS:1 n=1 Tax=Ambispora leptoticha TaxID=144679 RepID=A0A9N8WDX3_9GLOM|nr:10922_t:CDS:2 [Ambispora leptoticha]
MRDLIFLTLHIYLILTLVCCIVGAEIPTSRQNLAGAIIDNKLYVFGGQRISGTAVTDTTADTNELWILDLTKSFDISSPPWVQGTSTNAPLVAYHTANVGGPENELLIIYGGENPNPIPSSPYAVYNTKTQEWSTANFDSASFVNRRKGHTGVTNFNDATIIYYAGKRYADFDNLENKALLNNELFIVFTGVDTWTTHVLPSGPEFIAFHTSTLLNGKMYVIGGALDANKLMKMDQILVFDLKKSQWISTPATGSDIPSERLGHTAVGTWDNKIIIYGGTTNFTSYFNDLYVLDTTTYPYTWSNIATNGIIPSGRTSHSMVMAGTNLIITFGQHVDQLKNGYPNNTLVLDTTTYTWQTTYTPSKLELTTPPKPNITYNTNSTDGKSSNATPSSSATSSSSDSTSKIALIIGLVGGIFGVLMFGAAIFLFFKWKKHRYMIQNTQNSTTNNANIVNSIFSGRPMKTDETGGRDDIEEGQLRYMDRDSANEPVEL